MDVAVSLGAQPTDELSELPKYDSYHGEINFCVQGKKLEKQGLHRQEMTSHTYRVDTRRKAPKQAFFGQGLHSLETR
jgi:hypothetical protein